MKRIMPTTRLQLARRTQPKRLKRCRIKVMHPSAAIVIKRRSAVGGSNRIATRIPVVPIPHVLQETSQSCRAAIVCSSVAPRGALNQDNQEVEFTRSGTAI